MGRRGRAGQGEGPSLSDLPGHDLWPKFTYTSHFGAWDGCAGRIGVAIPWLGAPPHRWARGAIGPSPYLGVGRGRDGQGVGPILSNHHGFALKRLPRKGWAAELGSSPPWEPYLCEATVTRIPEEGGDCGAWP